MLTEDLFLLLCRYCFCIEDAARLLIATGIAPRGVWAHLLRSAFLAAPRRGFSYYRIASDVEMLTTSAKHSILYDCRIVDKRWKRRRPVRFRSPVMRLLRATTVKCAYELVLQDPSQLFHMRLQGFFRRLQRCQQLRPQSFAQFFKSNCMVLRLPGAKKPCRLSQETFLKLVFEVAYNPIEHYFFPSVVSYDFLSP